MSFRKARRARGFRRRILSNRKAGLRDMDEKSPISLKSLREQVYDYLRESMNTGDLVPGSFMNLGEISTRLGISKTPLRDALLQLETEGFVRILPRRGCVVQTVTLEDIRDMYQIIGALEASVVLEVGRRLQGSVESMRRLVEEMRACLARDDFNGFYDANLRFHNAYLLLSANEPLKRVVQLQKQRLYDFPRRQTFVKEWEVASTGEHDAFVKLVAEGRLEEAAAFVRDVHWSFALQEKFISQYYADALRAQAREGHV